ncbi:putative membrane protein [Marmoricola sp. URHA0025 HA25]
MVVLLALVSATMYGLSDFVGGLVSRRVSAWPAAVVGQFSSTVCSAVVAVFVGGSPGHTDFVWGAVAGLGAGLGTAFLYRGFESGRMGVVAPVSAVGAAVVPVVAGAIDGERPGALMWIGIALAIPAIWLISTVPAATRGLERATLAAGLVDGVLAGLGFGGLFAALGQVPDSAGLWPLATAQASSVVAVIALATALGASWVPRSRRVTWALTTGPLGASATLAFLLATHHGFLTLAGVLASFYPAATVLLAVAVLRERVHRAQGVGLALCAVTIVLVSVA